MINGFLPIKELVYEIRDLKNYKTYRKLVNSGIKVRGIKTDSLLIDDSIKNIRKVKELFDFTDKIGNYKLEQDKFLSNSEVKCIDNKLPVIHNIEIKEHIVKNEYDNQELLDIMKDKNIFVKGLLPGVGKTSACKNNKNTLFVSPYNKLCQDLRKDGHDAITLNHLLGTTYHHMTV